MIRFYVATSLGNIELVVAPKEKITPEFESDSDKMLLRAAQQLGRAEPLICLLEDWLGVPLDFSPDCQIELGVERLKVILSLTLADSDDRVNAVLYLPLETVNHLSAPIPELAALMRWEAQPCKVSLTNVVIPSQQLERLEVGGMVLIPASFETFWRCQVSLCGHAPGLFSAELDAGQQRLIFDFFEPHNKPPVGDKNGISADSKWIDITLKSLLSIPVDRLLGWAEQPVFVFGQTLSGFEVMLNESQACLVEGDLIPISNGYGVSVKNVRGKT